MTTDEAARILGVTASRIRHMIAAGRLPAKKRGRDWWITKSDLAKVMNRKPGRPAKKGGK